MSDLPDRTELRTHLQRLLTGDEAALTAIYRALYLSLWRLALILVREPDIAEELLQDVFLALWRKRDTLDPADDIRAYLYAAVRNRARDLHRHHRVATQTEDAIQHGALSAPAAATPFPAPDDLVARETFYRAYHHALTTLTDRDRLAIFLRWEEELTLEQIGTILGVSTVGARSIILRVQAKLQRLLAPYR